MSLRSELKELVDGSHAVDWTEAVHDLLDRYPPEAKAEAGEPFAALLRAPCIFCGYTGPGYYQAGTHADGCPWKAVGGGRESQMREVITQMAGEWQEDATRPTPAANTEGLRERDWSKIRDYMDCLGDTEEEKKLRIRWAERKLRDAAHAYLTDECPPTVPAYRKLEDDLESAIKDMDSAIADIRGRRRHHE